MKTKRPPVRFRPMTDFDIPAVASAADGAYWADDLPSLLSSHLCVVATRDGLFVGYVIMALEDGHWRLVALEVVTQDRAADVAEELGWFLCSRLRPERPRIDTFVLASDIEACDSLRLFGFKARGITPERDGFIFRLAFDDAGGPVRPHGDIDECHGQA